MDNTFSFELPKQTCFTLNADSQHAAFVRLINEITNNAKMSKERIGHCVKWKEEIVLKNHFIDALQFILNASLKSPVMNQ